MGDYSEYHRNGLRGPDAIANKIIYTRKYPGKEHFSFLIVEGDTDRTFYKTFVDKDKCEVDNADSKSAAVQIVAILEKEAFPGVLAIVDADFDVLEGKSPPYSNVLFTDTHDLETMLIKAPAFEKLLAEFGSEEKISQIMQSTGKDIRDIFLACSMPIGYLRWVSLREGLALKFEGLDFAQLLLSNSISNVAGDPPQKA